jgi:formate dehydrogenase maturation protein FdhE
MEIDESGMPLASALVMAILLPINLILLYQFHHRRHVHPIKGRHPRVVMISCIVVTLGAIYIHCDLIWQLWPCSLYWWMVGGVCFLMVCIP